MEKPYPHFQLGQHVRIRVTWPGLPQGEGRIVAIERTVGIRYQVELNDGARFMYYGFMLQRIVTQLDLGVAS